MSAITRPSSPCNAWGMEVWPVNTVQFSNHPGYGAPHRPGVQRRAMCSDVVDGIAALAACWASALAVLSGYLGDPAVGDAVLHAVRHGAPLRTLHALYCCDPVIGDSDGPGVYVQAAIPAHAARATACHAADIATPEPVRTAAYLTGLDDPPRSPHAKAAAVSLACHDATVRMRAGHQPGRGGYAGRTVPSICWQSTRFGGVAGAHAETADRMPMGRATPSRRCSCSICLRTGPRAGRTLGCREFATFGLLQPHARGRVTRAADAWRPRTNSLRPAQNFSGRNPGRDYRRRKLLAMLPLSRQDRPLLLPERRSRLPSTVYAFACAFSTPIAAYFRCLACGQAPGACALAWREHRAGWAAIPGSQCCSAGSSACYPRPTTLPRMTCSGRARRR